MRSRTSRSTRSLIFLMIISVILLTTRVKSETQQFTATDLHSMKKLSYSTVSPDGKYAVITISQWDQTTGKVSSHLEFTDLASGASSLLTDGEHDSSPTFNPAYPSLVTFLRDSQVWYVPFPPSDKQLPTPVQLTNYEVSVDNIRFMGNSLVFSAEVYFSCVDQVFSCTAKLNKEVADRGPNSWGLYNKLMVRHWDTWLTEGKGNHIFLQQVTQDAETKLPKIDQANEPKDLMSGMEANSPVPPYGGTDHFDVSVDGNSVVFSMAERDNAEAWTTGWKTYMITPSQMNSPKHITSNTTARTQNPHFSPDGQKVAYLAMNRPGLESDNLHIEIYDSLTGNVAKITDELDRSVVDFMWYDGNSLLFICTDINVNKIYYVNINDKNSITTLTTDNNGYSTPILVDYASNKLLVERSSWVTPTEIAVFTLDTKNKKVNDLKSLYNPNADTIKQFNLQDTETFFFTGGYGDKVNGLLLKPKDFDQSKTYPLAFLVHGGPEGAWESSWSHRWNPQLWAHRGYAVVMINPHGSSGVGIKYQDAVRDDWGGVPYKDLMTGLDYVLANYKFIDSDRMCACGASYGGYMVNWIQGQTDRFKCLVTHDGVFSTLSMFYATEEIWFPYAEYCPRDKVGCTPYDSNFRERYLKYSPESYVQNWKTPHLIIHGSKDFRIPISEGLSAFTALQVKGIKSRFLHFDMENHWVLRAENSIKWYKEVLEWLDENTQSKEHSQFHALEFLQ